MAALSNRSPSPLSSRPINPNPRNSENTSATRRSFSGSNPFAKPSVLTNPRRFDPITPANSPSEFARRRSVGTEGTGSCLKDCDEKENVEKNHALKASKLQSQAKGSKNFMAPTISAASKFSPSPKKKVLVERNDPVRTSISLSDGKAMFFSSTSSSVSEDLESKSEMGYQQSQKTEDSLDLNVADLEKRQAAKEGPPVSKPLKRVTFSDVPSDSQQETESFSDSVVTESDSLKLESSLENKISCSSNPPSIAPLDADPSLPPYDPKTNYLSPRPQFLHYKPNPRTTIFLNKEKGMDPDEVKRLEDSFMAEIMSESFSESEDSHKEELNFAASTDTVVGTEDEIEDDPCAASKLHELLPVNSAVANDISEEILVQEKKKKPRPLSRSMCFSLVLVFLIASVSLSVTYSPAFDNLPLEALSLSDVSNFYHQSRLAAAAKLNSDWLARNVNQFAVNSLSFISKLASELGKGENPGPLQFMNLSGLQKKTWNWGQFLNKEMRKELVENLEEDDEFEGEADTEMDEFEGEEANEEVVSDEGLEKEFNTKEEDIKPQDVAENGEEDDEFERDVGAELNASEKEEAAYLEVDSDETKQDVLKTVEVQADRVELAELESENSENIEKNSAGEIAALSQVQDSELEAVVEVASDDVDETEKSHDLGFSVSTDITSLDQKTPLDANSSSEGVQSSSPSSGDIFLGRYAVGASSILAALFAVAAIMYQYRRNHPMAMQSDPFSSKLSGSKPVFQEKSFSRNWQTEVDVIGESCPSEMSSSFQNTALRGASEVQSLERRKTRKYSKRESLDSSSEYSTGSPSSYGSFTTFERIPIRSASGDEEIVTPVRRSSRIRNHQVISP